MAMCKLHVDNKENNNSNTNHVTTQDEDIEIVNIVVNEEGNHTVKDKQNTEKISSFIDYDNLEVSSDEESDSMENGGKHSYA